MFTAHTLNHSIGLTKFMDDLQHMQSLPEKNKVFPPHRIVATGGNNEAGEFNMYILTLALAGYYKDNISGKLIEEGTLRISSEGEKLKDTKETQYLYNGIACRSFTKDFKLSPYMTVKSVSFKDGLLHIYLEHKLPEEKKPKIFTIN